MHAPSKQRIVDRRDVERRIPKQTSLCLELSEQVAPARDPARFDSHEPRNLIMATRVEKLRSGDDPVATRVCDVDRARFKIRGSRIQTGWFACQAGRHAQELPE